MCARCGLCPCDSVSRCLRAGGVTDNLCMGVPDSVLQTLSRHVSLESLKPYKKLTGQNLGTGGDLRVNTQVLCRGSGSINDFDESGDAVGLCTAPRWSFPALFPRRSLTRPQSTSIKAVVFKLSVYRLLIDIISNGARVFA